MIPSSKTVKINETKNADLVLSFLDSGSSDYMMEFSLDGMKVVEGSEKSKPDKEAEATPQPNVVEDDPLNEYKEQPNETINSGSSSSEKNSTSGGDAGGGGDSVPEK